MILQCGDVKFESTAAKSKSTVLRVRVHIHRLWRPQDELKSSIHNAAVNEMDRISWQTLLDFVSKLAYEYIKSAWIHVWVLRIWVQSKKWTLSHTYTCVWTRVSN